VTDYDGIFSSSPPLAAASVPEMTSPLHASRYQSWLDREKGAFALDRCRDLLRGLFSTWPRRSRSMLVLNAGSADFLETLWEAGFDVTGQDSDPDFLERARKCLGRRAEFVLSAPDHLPFADCSFDYAVAVAALEFWDKPEAVLEEMGRLACAGVIIIFPNAWSLFGLECHLRKADPLCSSALPLLRNPRALARMTRSVYGRNKTAWASVLPASSHTWRNGGLFRLLNSLRVPFPLGAFVGIRIDFGPLYTGTPMVISSSDPVASAK
jgi:SAM-dependent methyltransferase